MAAEFGGSGELVWDVKTVVVRVTVESPVSMERGEAAKRKRRPRRRKTTSKIGGDKFLKRLWRGCCRSLLGGVAAGAGSCPSGWCGMFVAWGLTCATVLWRGW